MSQIFPDCKTIRILKTTSTNCYMQQLSNTEKLAEGSIVVTDNQTQGRGQASNAWESAPEANLTFSIILYPLLVKASEQFILSKVISLAVYDFISDFVSAGVSVKWPNDVYVDDKKIAGILIENFVTGEYLTKTIAGIGVNINQQQFESDAPNPVSLFQLTGKIYDLEDCLKALHERIANRYYIVMEDAEKINSDYLQHLYRFGKMNSYRADGVSFDAIITGINRYGMLELTTANNERKAFGFREIKFLY